jgi:hypothetical protein
VLHHELVLVLAVVTREVLVDSVGALQESIGKLLQTGGALRQEGGEVDGVRGSDVEGANGDWEGVRRGRKGGSEDDVTGEGIGVEVELSNGRGLDKAVARRQSLRE